MAVGSINAVLRLVTGGFEADAKRAGGIIDGLKKQVGARSGLKDVSEILVGGGAIAGITLAAKVLNNTADAIDDLNKKFRAGTIDAMGYADSITRQIPAVGGLYAVLVRLNPEYQKWIQNQEKAAAVSKNNERAGLARDDAIGAASAFVAKGASAANPIQAQLDALDIATEEARSKQRRSANVAGANLPALRKAYREANAEVARIAGEVVDTATSGGGADEMRAAELKRIEAGRALRMGERQAAMERENAARRLADIEKSAAQQRDAILGKNQGKDIYSRIKDGLSGITSEARSFIEESLKLRREAMQPWEEYEETIARVQDAVKRLLITEEQGNVIIGKAAEKLAGNDIAESERDVKARRERDRRRKEQENRDILDEFKRQNKEREDNIDRMARNALAGTDRTSPPTAALASLGSGEAFAIAMQQQPGRQTAEQLAQKQLDIEKQQEARLREIKAAIEKAIPPEGGI